MHATARHATALQAVWGLGHRRSGSPLPSPGLETAFASCAAGILPTAGAAAVECEENYGATSKGECVKVRAPLPLAEPCRPALGVTAA